MLQHTKYVHLLWMFLYITGMIKPVLPYVEYAFNKCYIAKVLCENKDKPRLKCDGKCYLKKQLKASQSNSSSTESVPTVDLRDYPYALLLVFPVINSYLLENISSLLSSNIGVPKKVSSTIFRPPIALS